MTRRTEASFVLDGQQGIVEWSYAAAAILAISEEAAVGRACFDVVRGVDPFGRAVCRLNCSAYGALLNGSLTGRCSLRIKHMGKPENRFECNLVALPRVSGGALATLVEHRQERESAPASSRASAASTFSSAPAAYHVAHDLAAVATLSTTLLPGVPEQSVERTLDLLRQAAGVESAELFLVEPRGSDMLLTSYRGPFRTAFSQITRFSRGEGFPGLVQSRGEPILTRDLPADPRYLRTRVKERGFRSYVCVPVNGTQGVVGALNVASRRPDLDLDRICRLLSWASTPLSTVLEADLLRGRISIGAGAGGALANAEADLDTCLRALLGEMMTLGDASGGALFLYDRTVQGLVRRITEGGFAGVICPDIADASPRVCPALAGGHGIALYGPRHGWPPPCRRMSARDAVVYCVPMMACDETMGIIQLGCRGRVPSPPTRHLPFLLNAAEQAAQTVAQAWATHQEQERNEARYEKGEQQASRGPARAKASRTQAMVRGQERTEPAETYLQVRCFGSFQIYRDGKLLGAETFDRRSSLTLLKILVTHVGRSVTRDALVELLWPEAQPRTGANRLHVAVHVLRRLVEPAPQERSWRYICNTGDGYCFNTEVPYSLDVESFRVCVGRGDELVRTGDVTRAIDTYEAAVNLYKGDFMEDEPYAEWCRWEREHLRETALGVMRRLAGLCVHEGDLEASVVRYRQALRLDPLREDNRRGLMQALWLAGRRDEALREYDNCQEVLQRTLGVPPLRQTEQLRRRMQNGDERLLVPDFDAIEVEPSRRRIQNGDERLLDHGSLT